MRITNKMMMDNAVQSMSENLDKMSKLQTKISSTKDFQYASEDPARASASLSLRSNLRSLESYSATASNTQDWMTATDMAFEKLDQIAVQAQNLILGGLNDTMTDSERANSIGSQLQTLVNQALELGNSTDNGQYIFSGVNINQKAFVLTDSTGIPTVPPTANPTLVKFQGDTTTPTTGLIQRSLGPDQTVTLNVRGDQAIQAFLQSLLDANNAVKQNQIHDPGTLPGTPTLQTSLAGLQSSLITMDQFRASNGARMRQVESASNFLDTVKIETSSLLSQKEDTNMAEAIAMLENQKTSYQAVLEVSKRAISALTLFDYLQ